MAKTVSASGKKKTIGKTVLNGAQKLAGKKLASKPTSKAVLTKQASKNTSPAPAASLAPAKSLKSKAVKNNAPISSASASVTMAPAVPTLTGQKEDFNPAVAAVKGYRSNPDMENFFRFIYEHDLRQEALGILDQILAERQAARLKKA